LATSTLGVRLGGREFWLAQGSFVLGRHPDCQLVLDDGLVSRRHARVVVTDRTLTVEDLGSANGVFVNGKRIPRGVPAPLHEGDLFTVGAAEIRVIRGDPRTARTATTEAGRRRREEPDTLPGSVEGRSAARAASSAIGPEATGRVDAVQVMGLVAERAIAEGRLAEAEQQLEAHLMNALVAARQGPLTDEQLHSVSRYALKLAVATRRGRWFDLVVDVHLAQKKPFPGAVLVDLQVASEEVDAVDATKLDALAALLAARAGELDDREKLLADRVRELAAVARRAGSRRRQGSR
jgi:pSer/pThr/pTyr-binding forkhead associated (FHA) protein